MEKNMGLTSMLKIRVTEKQREVLKQIAIENGINESAFCRNLIFLAIMPKPKKTMLEKVMERVKEERKWLYAGNKLPRKRRTKTEPTE